MVTVQADDLREHVSITSVALNARGGVPFPVRAADSGLIANTWYPAARSAVTHGPRSVSIPTMTCPAACSGDSSDQPAGACAATSACSRVMPSSPSGSRARASRRPLSSSISTSW